MRIPRALALSILASVALPSTVAGQTSPPDGGISVVLQSVSIGGMEVRNLTDDDITSRGYNAEECASSATVTSVFRVSNVPANITYVDVWIGDSSTDCAPVTAREGAVADRACTHLTGVDPTITLDSEITLTLTQMLDPDDSACDTTTATGRNQLLWLFAADSQETTSAVTTAQYGWVAFTVDPIAPTIPTMDDAGDELAGNSSIPISWSVGSEMNLRYNVYVDTSIGACGEPGAFTPGQPPPATAMPIGVTANSTDLSTSAAGLELGDSALVYVTAYDRSENESNLSQAVCITRVETVGFCEALDEGGEPCTNSCAATLPTSRGASGAAWLGLIFLALVVRRRAR